MKVNSEVCKLAIVNKCKEILETIKDEFEPRLTHDQAKQSLELKNWNLRYEETCEYTKPSTIERMFDCKPFYDQLRAYVYTDKSDIMIFKVDVQGE